jgi:multimeric flavodoxin WrbA
MTAPMKILGIQGSPCLDGTTAQLLDAVLAGAGDEGASTRRVDLAKVRVDPCRECRACDSGGGCTRKGDVMDTLYRDIREADGIVLASPIFFMGVTAQTKALIDRCQCFWVEKYVLKKRAYEGRRRPKGLFVSCAGSSKPIVFEPAIHVVKSFFAAVDYEYIGEVLVGNTDDPELSSRMPAALESARSAGRKLCA